MKKLIEEIGLSLNNIYKNEELSAITRAICCDLLGISTTTYYIKEKVILTTEQKLRFDEIIRRLQQGEPLQYLEGKAPFCGMDFVVRPGILIPRPETEELAMLVVNAAEPGDKILDLCTGSGCIAIALKRMVQNSDVWAMDLSREALAIARENGAEYAPDVHFVEGDALVDFSGLFGDVKFDAIVSNPPYIPDSDRSLMRPNVTEHEPDMALFVEDGDPLVFYRAIARCGRKMLNVDGRLYFEIYELLVEEMMSMLEAEGYADIVVKEDFRGKPRMICARVNSIER